MCGFGEKDRRPIDPPPICELVIIIFFLILYKI